MTDTTTDTFDQLTPDQLARPYGGIPAAAQWIMMHESGGRRCSGGGPWLDAAVKSTIASLPPGLSARARARA